jgi:predicted amidohydrolase YtcJ
MYASEWSGPSPEWVRVDGVKYFHDDWARLSRFELDEILAHSIAARRRLVFHVLSSRALASLLDALERLPPDARASAGLVRVDHVDEADEAQARRLAQLGVVACENPSMLPEWRSERAFPLHTLAAAGVRTCIGTDWVGAHQPPRPLAPLESIALAVTHGGLGERERVSARAALEAYTVGSAAAEGMAGQTGALVVGQLGDLVVLSSDPTAVQPEAISAVQVVMTVVGGRIVFRGNGL